MADPTHAVHQTIDAVWRVESARFIAGLARLLRDVGLAEELAHAGTPGARGWACKSPEQARQPASRIDTLQPARLP